ncbi:hypothetical protein HDV64DRAFT_160462 [Trichoderma sp. TUCIM 5745]
MTTRQAALSLYRRSLKLALDWAVHRQLWRGQALYIRSLFEANRKVSDPRQQRVSAFSPPSRSTTGVNCASGVIGRDRKVTRELEAPRPVYSANSPGRIQIRTKPSFSDSRPPSSSSRPSLRPQSAPNTDLQYIAKYNQNSTIKTNFKNEEECEYDASINRKKRSRICSN